MQAELPEYVPEAVRREARPLRLRRMESLYHQGDPVTAIYFVCHGELEAVRFSPAGDTLVMLRAGAGEFFAEPALAVEYYGCSAYAKVDSELLSLPKPAMLAALQSDNVFCMAFLQSQIKNAQRQCSRYERVRLRRAEDRIVHYLVTEGGPDGCVTLDGPLADWAAELGLQPESLYRALARLRAEGRIEGEGNTLRIRQAK
jgi:CRP/FNR family transcriptional regulator